MDKSLSSIHPYAKVAEDVVIDPFVCIHENVEIAEGCWIGSNVTIMDGARIGKNCKIFPGAVISAIPQDLKFKGEETTVEIGDNTTIRECVTVNKGTIAKGKTIIGNNCLLMAYVHVAHDCIIGNNVIINNSVGLAGEIIVDDYAIIGGMSGAHQFVRIGAHVMVGGGSLIGKDIPPYVLAGRNPLSFGGINVIGLRRRGFTDDKIQEIQDIYRIIYQQNLNISNACDLVEKEVKASPERDEIINFIRNSKRGIIKGFSSVRD
ncbi:acyl-ACP--UDP-N-acetylglucosamine O-acyltransferase [Bacteroidota bacterium]